MADVKDYLRKSRKLFRLFIKTHLSQYLRDTHFARVGPGTGYWYYYRDGEVIQHMRDIAYNLEETFGNVTIPGEFPSPKKLVEVWSRFSEFLVQKNELFQDIINISENKNQTLPEPFWTVRKVHGDTLELMEEIMKLDEVKEILVPDVKKKDVPATESFDIIIITALHDTEYEALKRLPVTQEPVIFKNDNTNYRKCIIGNQAVLFATDDKMGMAASAALTTKLITKFSPKYIIMAGVAAGVKDNEKNYGDILVARFSWNYDAGKYKFNQKTGKTDFEPNPEQVELESSIVHKINELKSDKNLLQEIKNKFAPTQFDKQPSATLKLFLGPMASGSAVLADEIKVASIRRKNRKLIGIDMETYGVYYSVKTYSAENSIKAISIKSISDFADQKKSDHYRNFAAHTSAFFIYELIFQKLQ